MMLIAGAGGHAKDIIAISKASLESEFIFFDDITYPPKKKFLDTFDVINSIAEAREHFKINSEFIIAIGGSKSRKIIFDKLNDAGGKVSSFICNNSTIGSKDVSLGSGLNIMSNVLISNSVVIGFGSLINFGASIHHDVQVGNFCEISPGVRILGNVSVGDFTSVGANTTILPGVNIGKNVTIGAGSVVTKNIPDNSIVFGVPAKRK